jgi:predicted transcriptional regulator
MTRRTNALCIKLTDEERARLDAMAWKARLATSTFARSHLLSEADRRDIRIQQIEDSQRDAEEKAEEEER